MCLFEGLNALSRKNENGDNDEEEGVEDYDTWKNRVLEEAYKSLKSMKWLSEQYVYFSKCFFILK